MTVPDQREEQTFDTTPVEQEVSHVEQESASDFSFDHQGEDNNRIGRALSDARVAKGWSIEEVSQLLKVRGQMIKSLEDGVVNPKDWIYVQGFYKAYSDLLGVDRNGLPELRQPSGMKGVERYSAVSGKPVFCQELSDENIPRPVETSRILYIIFAALIAGFVFVAGYFVVINSGNLIRYAQGLESKIWRSAYIVNTFPGTGPTSQAPVPTDAPVTSSSPEVTVPPALEH